MKPLAVVPLVAEAGAAWGAPVDSPAASSLATVKRVYVESLGASPPAVMLRDMVISSLASSGLFAVTENADHADAILRGSAEDMIYDEQHHSTDSITAGIKSGSSDSFSSKYDRTNDTKSSGLNIGQNETMNSVERRHEASASVRLVNRDGDVIWSTTMESNGAKFKSSSADVADRIVKKLTEDLQRARTVLSRGPAGVPVSSAMQAGTPVR
jgi:hypothetical protein